MNRKARRMLKSLGIGSKAPTDTQDILKEFSQAAAEAGQLQYQITVKQEELQEVNKRLRKLNLAYAEVLAEQKAAAPSNSGEGETPAPSSLPEGE